MKKAVFHCLTLFYSSCYAVSSTWNPADPLIDLNWSTSANWQPNVVPGLIGNTNVGAVFPSSLITFNPVLDVPITLPEIDFQGSYAIRLK
jgi:hypothetical protein